MHLRSWDADQQRVSSPETLHSGRNRKHPLVLRVEWNVENHILPNAVVLTSSVPFPGTVHYELHEPQLPPQVIDERKHSRYRPCAQEKSQPLSAAFRAWLLRSNPSFRCCTTMSLAIRYLLAVHVTFYCPCFCSSCYPNYYFDFYFFGPSASTTTTTLALLSSEKQT